MKRLALVLLMTAGLVVVARVSSLGHRAATACADDSGDDGDDGDDAGSGT